jgi:hypothetical protein
MYNKRKQYKINDWRYSMFDSFFRVVLRRISGPGDQITRRVK